MPYFIESNKTDQAVVGKVTNFERGDMDAYIRPICRGEPLTREILAAIPDPLDLKGPGQKKPPDYFDPSPPIFSDKLRGIIEEFEPGLHTFIPVRLRADLGHGKKTIFENYSFLHQTQKIDCVLIDDDMRFGGGYGKAGFEKNGVISSFEPHPKINESAIQGRHFWRWSRVRIGFFCSDALHDRLIAEGVTGFKYRSCRVQ